MEETEFSFNVKDEEHTKKLGAVLARIMPAFSRRGQTSGMRVFRR